MLPIPTPLAVSAFFGALAALLVGTLAGSLAATVVGIGLAIVLASALAVTIPLGRRVRRQRLEFAWWLASGDPGAGGGAAVPRTPFEVRCFMRHRGPDALVLSRLDPIVPGGADRLDGDEPDDLAVAGHSRTELSFRFVAPAIGRVVLHGLAVTVRGPLGLFEVPLYFPNPLVIKVLPQAAARRSSSARAMPGLPVERSGQSLFAPHGGGTELRELREMRPGDPFKSIAWKQSARRGWGAAGGVAPRLLVREVDQEVQETRYVVLDVSGTMRGGEPGERKIDHAMEAVAAEAKRTLSNGDRFGLVTVDGRILAHVSAKDGAAHLLRVFDALVAATEVVDHDLTDVDDEEVAAIVGRYIRQQDGIDYSVPAKDGRPAGWSAQLLLRHVEKALASEAVKVPPALAASPMMSRFRTFCRVRGIPLPYRPDPRDGAKGPGLSAALREIGQQSLGPMSITVITDLDGIGDSAPMVSAVKLLRLHGHEVSFVVHDAPSFAPPPRTELEKLLVRVFERGERRRAAEMRVKLSALGVPLIAAQASDAAATLLWKIRSRQKVRAPA